MTKTVLGIIGGSGVYQIDGLENARWQTVRSPWGLPSDQLLTGTYAGVDLVFLPRHGRGHLQTPSSINYRANIDALKRCHRPDQCLGLRFAEGRIAARHLCDGGPVHRPHLCA